jgi:hypothetical protein
MTNEGAKRAIELIAEGFTFAGGVVEKTPVAKGLEHPIHAMGLIDFFTARQKFIDVTKALAGQGWDWNAILQATFAIISFLSEEIPVILDRLSKIFGPKGNG